MSIIPPKRKSKALSEIEVTGFKLLVESSRPEFWAVEEPEHTRRNQALEHELDIIEIFFHRVAGTPIPERLKVYPMAWWGEKKL